MAFEKVIKELEHRRAHAHQMGGPKKIGVQHDRGRYTARERIDKLLNKDSFGLGDIQIFLWHGLPRRLALWIP